MKKLTGFILIVILGTSIVINVSVLNSSVALAGPDGQRDDTTLLKILDQVNQIDEANIRGVDDLRNYESAIRKLEPFVGKDPLTNRLIFNTLAVEVGTARTRDDNLGFVYPAQLLARMLSHNYFSNHPEANGIGPFYYRSNVRKAVLDVLLSFLDDSEDIVSNWIKKLPALSISPNRTRGPGQVPSDAAIELVRAIKSSEALTAIGNFGENLSLNSDTKERMLDIIIEVIEDNRSWREQKQAIWALGELKFATDDVIETLYDVVEDTDVSDFIKGGARESLTKLGLPIKRQ